MITSDTPEQKIEYNKELAKEQSLECGYFHYTQTYHTYTGNRSAIETQIYHAIVKGNKLLNKVLVEKFTTNTRLNFHDTKNSEETHNKKLKKKIKKYTCIRNSLDIINRGIRHG